jgi:thiamine biosynthesis lipoprotein
MHAGFSWAIQAGFRSMALPEGLTYTDRFLAMGGLGRIIIDGLEKSRFELVVSAAKAHIELLEARYSRYRANSLISTINARAGSGLWTEVDHDTNWLFDAASALFEASGGAFDITSGVYRRVWDFRDPRAVTPTQGEIDRCRELVSWPVVQRRRLGPYAEIHLPVAGMELDFGGLAKEFAIDKVCELLISMGVSSALVDLAGDIRVIGARETGQPWLIGIANPMPKQKVEIEIAQIPVVNLAVTTSGNYARYQLKDGRRLGHILDARTGWPVEHWDSVTVVGAYAIQAGGLSTLAMLGGLQSLSLLRSSGLRFLAIDKDGERYIN